MKAPLHLKIIISLAFLALPGTLFAMRHTPSGVDDTIPAEPRCDKYYYTKWFDDCPNWRPNGVWDSCFCFKYEFSMSLADCFQASLPNGNMPTTGE